MAMLLRTSKRNVALGIRIVCLITVTLTFVVVGVVKGKNGYGVTTVGVTAGKKSFVNTFS